MRQADGHTYTTDEPAIERWLDKAKVQHVTVHVQLVTC